MKNIFRLLFASALLFWLGCTTTQPSKKQAPQQATGQVLQLFDKAQKAYIKKNYDLSLKYLKAIVDKHPDSSLAGDAFVMMGTIYEENKQDQSAVNAYLKVVQSPYYSSRENDAKYKAAKIYIRHAQYEKAEEMLESVIQNEVKDRELLRACNLLKADIQFYKQKNLLGLESLIRLYDLADSPAQKDVFLSRAMDVVNNKLNRDELMTIAGDRKYDLVRPAGLYRLGSVLFEEKDFSRAESYLSGVKALAPESRYAEMADDLIHQIDALSRTDSYTIGVVLPLSGRLAPIGERSLHGLELGLGIFGKNRSAFKLAVIDGDSDPDTARAAVERLVTEDHVIAIVGSLLSRTAEEVAQKANDLGVPSIGLSQRAGLSKIGANVFRHALTSEMQVEKLVETAMTKMKFSRFAILYPNEPYGVEFANLFWDEVLNRGGQITAVQTYPTGETDFRSYIRKMVGTYYIDDRREEYNMRLRKWKEDNKVISARRSPPEDMLPPITEFDAIFIPDSAKAVGQIAPMLEFNDIKGVTLLGTNLWNSKSFIERIGKYGENTLFVDSVPDASAGAVKKDFEESYQATFGDKPENISAQTYEVGLMLRQLIEDGARSRSSLQSALSEVRNFEGVSGKLSMSTNREILRPVTALTVKNSSVQVFE